MSKTWNRNRTRTYRIWTNIKTRCYNPNSPSYPNYGGRGIKLYRPWHNYKTFLRYVGECPGPNMTIDRIDNNRGYVPGNVRWATMAEQQRNRRNNVWITYKGQSRLMHEWAEITGISAKTLWNRYYLGWDEVSILTEPVHRTYSAEQRNAKVFNISSRRKLRKRSPLQKAA